MTRNGHTNSRQYSDQMVCSDCGRAWDVNDHEPPPCVPVALVQQTTRRRSWKKDKGVTPQQWSDLREAVRSGDWSKFNKNPDA